MRILFLIVALLLLAPSCLADSRTVDPADLQITVTLENIGATPYQHEMVLLTIHGVYKRHLTREKLEQPDFGSINWMQLGPDYWYESTVDGLKVKNLKRRMALFPDKAGELEIGPFIHHLTLLDEDNKWFPHNIHSEPIVLDVQEAPTTRDWWFPVRKLEVSDRWSNAPDQLDKGDGVLRVVTLKATGVGADMMPPMPELKSPSAHIFPHPEKRLVELSPDGPVAITFWRWTIKPRNGVSAILEPIEFSYFDTVQRKSKTVTISAQRVAFSEVETPLAKTGRINRPSTVIRSGLLSSFLVISLLVGLGLIVGRDQVLSAEALATQWKKMKLRWGLRHSIAARDLGAIRRVVHELNQSLPSNADRESLLKQLDRKIFSPKPGDFDYRVFYKKFCLTLK